MKTQIKSKQRVRDHGEVFTAPREVNAMLDLVKKATYDITAKFLEPSAGTGNFLVEILRRKLFAVNGEVCRKRLDFEAWQELSLRALASIYAIELLPDNVAECKKRMGKILAESYVKYFVKKNDFSIAVKFLWVARQLLDANIVQGDFLTFTHADGSAIKFIDWEKGGAPLDLSQMQNIYKSK